MRILIVAGLLVTGINCSPEQLGTSPDPEALRIVKNHVAAFNRHDVVGMMALVGKNVRWFSVLKDSVALEADGKEALRKSMEDYFGSIPSARSAIEDAITRGSFVAVRERAFWQGKSGEQSQASLAIYEVRDGLIQSVWYFPAQP